RNFRLGVALAARDYRAGMTHAAARRRRTSGNKADHGLLAASFGLVFQKLRGVFLGRPADFADHDNRLGLRVGQKQLEYCDELGSFPGIAANADRRGLSETLSAGLENRLIGQGARARNDADLAGLENIARHDADLALARRHYAGAVR